MNKNKPCVNHFWENTLVYLLQYLFSESAFDDQLDVDGTRWQIDYGLLNMQGTTNFELPLYALYPTLETLFKTKCTAAQGQHILSISNSQKMTSPL